MNNTIKVSLVDDESLFRKGINSLLSTYEDIQILHEVENGKAFLDKLRADDNHPDLVLLDLKMDEMNGIETSKVLVTDFPKIKIVVLTSHFSTGMVYNMLEIGVAAYLVKNTSIADVHHTITEVHKNGFYYSPDIQKIINQCLTNKPAIPKHSLQVKITSREKEILTLICQQYTNAEIANQLFISTRTVDGHRSNLLRKFDRKNTAGLVAYAIKEELVSLEPNI